MERHGSCGRTMVTATVASANPYPGHNDNGRKPVGANASANRSRVSARTASDPTMIARSRDRSSDPMRRLVRTASSSAKFGPVVIVAPVAEHVRSHDRGLAINVSGFMSVSRT